MKTISLKSLKAAGACPDALEWFEENFGDRAEIADVLKSAPNDYIIWAMGRSVKWARALLDHGADANARDGIGWTPLHLAARYGRDKTVQILIEHGADVNARDGIGWTPLHLAARCGHNKTVQILIEHGANVNAKDDCGQTPLFYAIQRSHNKIVQILKSNGAK